MESFLKLFLLFIIYSFIGYLAEVIYCSICNRKIVLNRGFLIGPILPIYGCGALVIVHLLERYANDVLVLFIMSFISCCIIEYFASLIMEKIFHLRWWDYSERKFNVNGRICLTNGILFGLGGLLLTKYINPVIDKFLSIFSTTTIINVSFVVLCLFLIDFILSTRIIFGLRSNISKITSRDATTQIKKEVNLFLKSHNILTGRLIKSFPNLEKINGPRIEKFLNIFSKVKKELEKIRKKERKRVEKEKRHSKRRG